MDVIVREGSAVLELISSENKSLLIWWDSLFLLDLGLTILDGVSWLDVKGDGLSSQGLDKNLHTSPKSENQVSGKFFLVFIARKSSSILQLFSGQDDSLLIWWDTLLVLDLGLDILD